MFKFLSFLTKVFKRKEEPEKVKVADRVPERKELKPVVRKRRERLGIWITRTALNCVVCGVPLVEYPRNPARIVYTCSDICRRMARSGKRNRRLLIRFFTKGGELWSGRQKAQYRLRTKDLMPQLHVKKGP